ncbi:MAG: RiPP maturation radical SAM C-methyltransferase [Promethearchaeota archaeon]
MKTVVLVQPPFADIGLPSIGLSTLKEILKYYDIESKILYANLVLAEKVSSTLYRGISLSFSGYLLGEWIFSSYAFPSGDSKQKKYIEKTKDITVTDPLSGKPLSINDFLKVKNLLGVYLNEVVNLILKEKPKIVGFSTIFHQTCASIAIANNLKKVNPDLITVLGGGNCSKPMGEALLEISPSIDYIFSGEADTEFLKFCSRILKNKAPKKRFIECVPIEDMNSLPYPDYFDFFEQKERYRIKLDVNALCLESSRGCWWGEKTHCLFCGLTLCNMKYRKKKPDRVKEEISYLVDKYKVEYIQTTDCIMPREFPSTLFEKFKKPAGLKSIFCEVKPILSFKELFILKSRSVNSFQPGLESLNDHLLKILKKGLNAANNIRFLRDCRTLAIRPDWNMLYGIPGEKEKDYEDMINIIPYIFHLTPPGYGPSGIGTTPLMIQRYSPLFNEFKKYKIGNLRPAEAYSYIFPEKADLQKLALFFDGEFEIVLKNELKDEFFSIINEWLKSWKNDPPNLFLIKPNEEYCLVGDTRPIATDRRRIIDNEHYKILKELRKPIVEKKVDAYIQSNNLNSQFEELLNWKYVIKVDNKFLSLLIEPLRVIELEKTLTIKN